ncbi:hypothetical protein TIFTF001_036188 [Ficus carica]|uniref:Uncharacterized protein n=1 Tax=Ficus carica TaxID=3494 RepID=A0AA88E756_FICCA|nr:hypothetical protein TIFTF001_036188 [Ficus carica]
MLVMITVQRVVNHIPLSMPTTMFHSCKRDFGTWVDIRVVTPDNPEIVGEWPNEAYPNSKTRTRGPWPTQGLLGGIGRGLGSPARGHGQGSGPTCGRFSGPTRRLGLVQGLPSGSAHGAPRILSHMDNGIVVAQ